MWWTGWQNTKTVSLTAVVSIRAVKSAKSAENQQQTDSQAGRKWCRRQYRYCEIIWMGERKLAVKQKSTQQERLELSGRCPNVWICYSSDWFSCLFDRCLFALICYDRVDRTTPISPPRSHFVTGNTVRTRGKICQMVRHFPTIRVCKLSSQAAHYRKLSSTIHWWIVPILFYLHYRQPNHGCVKSANDSGTFGKSQTTLNRAR